MTNRCWRLLSADRQTRPLAGNDAEPHARRPVDGHRLEHRLRTAVAVCQPDDLGRRADVLGRSLSQAGKIAAVLGKPKQEIAEWHQRADRSAAAIRRHLWDEKEGTFWCVSDKLAFKRVGSPIEFFALTAGGHARAGRRLLIRLKNPAKYGPARSILLDFPARRLTIRCLGSRTVGADRSGRCKPITRCADLASYGDQDEAAALANNLYG